jgi:hypothetical protein
MYQQPIMGKDGKCSKEGVVITVKPSFPSCLSQLGGGGVFSERPRGGEREEEKEGNVCERRY